MALSPHDIHPTAEELEIADFLEKSVDSSLRRRSLKKRSISVFMPALNFSKREQERVFAELRERYVEKGEWTNVCFSKHTQVDGISGYFVTLWC